jgi:hypothetical protein
MTASRLADALRAQADALRLLADALAAATPDPDSVAGTWVRVVAYLRGAVPPRVANARPDRVRSWAPSGAANPGWRGARPSMRGYPDTDIPR